MVQASSQLLLESLSLTRIHGEIHQIGARYCLLEHGTTRQCRSSSLGRYSSLRNMPFSYLVIREEVALGITIS